ncbi:hypothetical protein [Hymenobacter yonginensis]|uniref:DUF1049 domain-containing protein n=1 Tax=Hymenobacter yonginensis TaxID=748197 RepID=A0ABY7PT36_9BACT|nr:hypothetical protein [Hymenobacter yonginensis]WBO86072.1 hypothetical protein O9Z63_07405 [Hymenobacter yonginensis]
MVIIMRVLLVLFLILLLLAGLSYGVYEVFKWDLPLTLVLAFFWFWPMIWLPLLLLLIVACLWNLGVWAREQLQ